MENVTSPHTGQKITLVNGSLHTPDHPIIPFIEGDGIGPDVWKAARRVMDAAIEIAYHGARAIHWQEVLAGGKAHDALGVWLPDDTLQAFKEYKVGIKGPLTTPVGGGIRSLNVALRKDLDLYVCQRPVRWFDGVPSPVRNPQMVDMVTFRENTEDLYAGIEFAEGTPENQRLMDFLRENFPKAYESIRFPQTSGLGIKPISREGTERLVRASIQWALDNRRRVVTLVHKGNIMKFTEGAFRNWGYELAEREFGRYVYTRQQWQRTAKAKGEDAANVEQQEAKVNGALLINDMIADIVFEATITRPQEFDVLATMNLNGDYLSDALSAQVGGVGIAPGGNINYETGVAVFEATHGTAPILANQNKANPSSLILSGEMMLRYLGWEEAANLITCGIEKAIASRTLTVDLFRLVENARLVSTSEFADAVIAEMG